MSPYDPDNDPLIQRARSRNPGRSKWPFVIIAILVGWIAYTEYGRPRLAQRETALSSAPRLIQSAIDSVGTAPLENAGAPVGDQFSLGFVAGETRGIGVSVHIGGKGNPALTGTNGLTMNFDADVIVDVMEVADGAATLQLRSDNVNLFGNHFGNRVDLRRVNGVTQDFAGQQLAPSPTFANQRAEPWTIESFDHPATVRLGLDGSLPDAATLESVDRFYRFIVKLFTLVGVSFPAGELQVGDTWAREMQFELFGLPHPVNIIVETTVAGYGAYYGYQCVHLINTIRPGEASGVYAKVGRIDVSGESYAYYDPAVGRIVYGESTINVDIIVIEGLQAAADLLGVYAGLLDELEGGAEFDLSANPRQEEPLGLRIKSTVSMK